MSVSETKAPWTNHKRRFGWRWLLFLSLAAAAGLGSARSLFVAASSTQPSEPRSLPARVSALGRLSPEGEVVSVAPPTPTGALAGARVEQLLVAVGDEVTAGQLLAILDTHASRAATVAEAKAGIEIAKAKLAQVNAGPKPEDVVAQEAAIRKLEADLNFAQEEYDRTNGLIGTGAASREENSNRHSACQQAAAALDQGRAQLEALKAIRAVDVDAAEADVTLAEATLGVAQEDLRSTEVRSPLSGRVLSIRSRPGERVGDQGILDLGNTNVMQAVAEIYEQDIEKVRMGQSAKIRVSTTGVELSGEVVSQDLIVGRKVIFSNDPVADIDARVVEVHIRLSPQDSLRVAGLSNARVNVVIDVSGVTK